MTVDMQLLETETSVGYFAFALFGHEIEMVSVSEILRAISSDQSLDDLVIELIAVMVFSVRQNAFLTQLSRRLRKY